MPPRPGAQVLRHLGSLDPGSGQGVQPGRLETARLRCLLVRRQVPACPPHHQGVWAGETVVLAAPSSCHHERKHQAQVHSRCSVRGQSFPLWMPAEPESPGVGWALDSGCWKDINVQPFLARGAVVTSTPGHSCTCSLPPTAPSMHLPHASLSCMGAKARKADLTCKTSHQLWGHG